MTKTFRVKIAVPAWAKWIISDFSDWDRNPQEVTKLAPEGVWEVELPLEAYFEYAFMDEWGQVRADPENQEVAENPWTKEARAIWGPEYRASEASWGVEVGGRLERHRLPSIHLQQNRRLMTYTPLNHQTQNLPLIILQDGVAYYRFAKIHLTLEKLLAEQKIRPAHLLFLEPLDRSLEYPYFEPYQHFVVEEALPFIQDKLPLTGEKILMGASLGGLVSSLLLWHYPEHFHSLVSQSGAFLGSPQNKDYYRSQHSWFLERIRQEEKRDFRCYLEVGQFEWLHNINRDIYKTLQAKGYDCLYRERPAGHNWVNWRNGFAEALSFALATESSY
ncbi:MAG: alpha/beta hydrolase-fold protein [Deinococcales bacterium]